MATRYLEAEAHLVRAERIALDIGDFDTLGRLYMPLQEARRQRRQICGEGTVRLDLWATSDEDVFQPHELVKTISHGQLLIAGWADIAPAVEFRRLASEMGLFVETFLGAVYPLDADGLRRVVAIVPTDNITLPPADVALEGRLDELARRLPPFSIILADDEVPTGSHAGTAETFAYTMAIWEQLHLPFLTAAKATPDALRRIGQYRRAIEVDYACEKAHQWLATTAIDLARGSQAAATS